MAMCPQGKGPQRKKSPNVQKAFKNKGEYPKYFKVQTGLNSDIVVNMKNNTNNFNNNIDPQICLAALAARN